MSVWTKEVTINILKDKIANIQSNYEEFAKSVETAEKETLAFLQGLIDQIPNAISGPLIPKTPALAKKRNIKRIQTIPEDDVVVNESKVSGTGAEDSRMEDQTYDEVQPARTRRAASRKAAQNIKVQQSLGLGAKLRRPSEDKETGKNSLVRTRSSRAKRTISVGESSDDEYMGRPSKYSKIVKKSTDNENEEELVIPKVESNETYVKQTRSKNETLTQSPRERVSSNKRKREKSDEKLSRRNNQSSGKMNERSTAKKSNVVEETMEMAENDTMVEASLYEDATGKSIPMNSTMNPNSTVTFDRKMMNVTVVLEAIKYPIPMNETVTIKKTRSRQSSRGNETLVNEEPRTVERTVPRSPRATTPLVQSKINLQDKIKAIKETLANPEFDALITEDESSPEKEAEVETKKRNVNKEPEKDTKRFTRSSLLSDDDDVFDVTMTPPPKTASRDNKVPQSIKTLYKPNPLFSPYSKESVKKRVAAFEQAGLNSPKTVEIDAPPRLTRTKTRAMTAAAAETNFTQTGQTVAQKAARKSLVRAKEIAKMKKRKENEETKENNILNSAQKSNRLLATAEKLGLKQQQRTTPVGKSRLQMPMSVNRLQNTPASNQIINQSKLITPLKSNIITSVDSFIQPPKTLTKSNSTDNLVEKRRKVNDEDARRKREETLKALTEEKRRKREEKELKNKLAREAKEKLEMEKRLKQEKEREEKAKAALLLQEKQRELSERKKLIQMQRNLEKEERRRQEEQQRLYRLQEQEEAERQLAEQKRREQEAEKRKIAEVRAQQAAAAEAARVKALYLAKAKNANKHQQNSISYALDSEPDDDESDDESKPKHVIPYWALPNVRSAQLALQQYIPMSAILSFFGARRCTPDLTDLFKGIKKERLQRTSSAIWKTPPRFSMMTNDNE